MHVAASIESFFQSDITRCRSNAGHNFIPCDMSDNRLHTQIITGTIKAEKRLFTVCSRQPADET